MSRSGGAIAIFVKTPGLSPIKTRLAAHIGREHAERFYYLSASCIENVVKTVQQSSPELTPYWAIAESSGLAYPAWKSFSQVHQGDGSLGERLSFVYETLIKKHEYVIFVGADSPQITPRDVLAGIEQLKKNKFVFGPAEDGGFYLFGGTVPISKEIWLDVPYSASETFIKLSQNLEKIGSVSKIDPLFDVDTFDDLRKLFSISKSSKFSSKQYELFQWIDDFFLQKSSHEKRD